VDRESFLKRMLRSSKKIGGGVCLFSNAPDSGFGFIHNRYRKMFRQEISNVAPWGKLHRDKNARAPFKKRRFGSLSLKCDGKTDGQISLQKQEIQAISNDHLPIIQVSVELEPTKGFCGFDSGSYLGHPGAGFSACLVKSRLDRSPEFLNRRPIRKVLSHLSVDSAFWGSFHTYPAGPIEKLKFF
jgi:hypothetical protein